MSTTYMTIHDLLRITYTYESQALERGQMSSPSHPQSFRPRADSSMSICEYPSTCQRLALAGASHTNTSAVNPFAALETDFTAQFARRGSAGGASDNGKSQLSHSESAT